MSQGLWELVAMRTSLERRKCNKAMWASRLRSRQLTSRRLLLIVLLAAFAVLVAGSVALAESLRFALVVSPPANEYGVYYNALATQGAEWAAQDFGAEVQVIQCTFDDARDRLRGLAQSQEYDLIAIGDFFLLEALWSVADEFPSQRFATIDAPAFQQNVMDFVFRLNEVGALLGALAAVTAVEYGLSHVGLILPLQIPYFFAWEAGFRFGMDWGLKSYADEVDAPADIRLLYSYTGTYDDIEVGRAFTEAMVAGGAACVLSVAGGLSAGVLEAISSAHASSGEDVGPPYYLDGFLPSYIGNGLHVLSSGMVRPDAAVYTAMQHVARGTFQGGGLVELGLAEEAVGIADYYGFSGALEALLAAGYRTAEGNNEAILNWARTHLSVPDVVWDALADFEGLVSNGSVVVPTASSDDEIATVRGKYALGAP